MNYLPTKELYRQWSLTYDDPGNPLVESENKVVATMIGDVVGQKVLDLGCGTGRHAIALAKRGASVTGVDFSDDMLAVARKNAAGLDASFINSEIHAVPLHEKFDLVFCSLVLSHVPELLPPMMEISRLTQTGGRIIITDLRTDHWLRKKKPIKMFGDFVTDSYRHTIADYRSAINTAGLHLASVRKIYFDDEIVSRLPWYFYLKFIAVGYAFEINKNVVESTHDSPKKQIIP